MAGIGRRSREAGRGGPGGRSGLVGRESIAGKKQSSGLRGPCLLFSFGTIFAIAPPYIIATFDWRYELPQLSLIPIAAVLGVTAIAGRADDRTPPMDQTSTGQPSVDIPVRG